MVKPQSLKEPDSEDSDDNMGPESDNAESYISAVAPIFIGHCVLDRLNRGSAKQGVIQGSSYNISNIAGDRKGPARGALTAIFEML